MTDLSHKISANSAVVSPRTTLIPIVSSAKAAANFRGPVSDKERDEEVDELSESYTCVISHLGSNVVEKRVYFDDKLMGLVVIAAVLLVWMEFRTADFLSSCYLCKRQLQGLDIFMYREGKHDGCGLLVCFLNSLV
ncbi:hypothetical protein FH972_009294 [Carpinus fangiana]|uniref:FLZ-type domain-containing protein n=1 Tax=Carpinus fangiana TaxID=176857 RepID=A0A5N6R1E8_9ROSI|nr:hypothetical protein FH972_009294 [Carpinus fangiana]